MEMRSGHIEVFVNDAKKAKEFYMDKLGFELAAEQQEGKILWLKSGNNIFLFRPGKMSFPAAGTYDTTNIAFVLYTDDLPAAIDDLKAKGIEVQGYDGSDKCPVFCDPFGNWIQLVNPEDH